MTLDDESLAAGQDPPAAQEAQGTPRSPSELARPAPSAAKTLTGQRISPDRLRAGRPWWKWLMIGLLLAFSAGVTVLFAASLTTAVLEHHWALALDDCRDAIPAAVGWAAVLIVLFAGGGTAADRMLSAESHAVAEAEKQAARNADSVRRAQQRVRKLSARLATLTATITASLPASAGEHPACQQADPGRLAAEASDLETLADSGSGRRADRAGPGSGGQGSGHAGSGHAGSARAVGTRTVAALPGGGRHLVRQIADTTARLDRARQWLTSAQAALAARNRDAEAARDRLADDFPDSARRPRRTAGRVA